MQTETPPSELEPLVAKNDVITTLLEGRLHPLTMLLGLIGSIRKLILPSIPLLVLGKNFSIGYGIFGLMLLSTVSSQLIKYFTFSYRIQGNDLITREGIIERKERHIPLNKIHEIRIEQNLLQRLFDVVEAVIETASAGGAEAKLAVLSRSDAERLRATVSAHAAQQRTPLLNADVPLAETPTVIKKLSLGDLILHGLTANHLLSALAILGTFWAFADDVLPDSIYARLGKWLKIGLGQVAHQGLNKTIIVAALGFVLLVIAGLIFSVVGSVVRFFDFTLTRTGNDLHRRYGLLTRHASTLPQRRIQVLKIEEGLIRRWFGLASLRADLSGSKKDREDDNTGRDVLIPLVQRDELDSLLSIFLPQLADEPAVWKLVSRVAIRRMMFFFMTIVLLSVVVLSFNLPSWHGLWLLALSPLLYWLSVKSYKNFGYALGEKYFRTRSGWLGRKSYLVPLEKSQVIVVRQSPFDRRLQVATLSVDTAGKAYTGGSPRISNLPVNEALQIARVIAHRATMAGTKF